MSSINLDHVKALITLKPLLKRRSTLATSASNWLCPVELLFSVMVPSIFTGFSNWLKESC